MKPVQSPVSHISWIPLILLCLLPIDAASAQAPSAQAPVAPSDPGIGGGPERPAAEPTADAWKRTGAVRNVDTGATFADIQTAIDDAGTLAGHTLEITVLDLPQGPVTVSKNLTLRGATGNEVVRATTDTGSSGDARGWFLISPGVDLTVRDLTFDGDGTKIYQAFRHRGTGLFENVSFYDIQFDASGPFYAGAAIVAFGGRVDVRDSHFEQIGRLGVLAFGSGMNGAELTGNTYVGKGAGNFLDYGLEVGGGAMVTLRGNRISNCRGTASDGSVSSAVLVTTASGAGTLATVIGNDLVDSSYGLRTGNAGDTSTLAARHNRLVGNDIGADGNSPSMTLEQNWWGCNGGPGAAGCDTAAAGDADPWLVLDLQGTLAVVPLSTSPFVASLTLDSDGVDTSAAGAVADGIPALFGADAGSFSPTTVPTTDGTATGSFTAGAAGPDTVRVTVDSQTVSLSIDVDPAHGALLDIDDAVPARTGQKVGVPIRLVDGGDISSVAFSVDPDESCLSFDPADGDLDGIPDDAVFNLAALPHQPTFGLTYDGSDTGGEFQIFLADFGLPPLTPLPSDVLVTLYFTVTCTAPNDFLDVPVRFADDPDASFGNTQGQSVPGSISHGFVRVFSGLPGDCNGDGVVDAGDLSACPLEIFDGDGNFWADVPGGTFAGDAVGCDANEDGIVDSGDSSCKVLIIFNGQGACDGAQAARQTAPVLGLRPFEPVQIGDELRLFVDLRHGSDVNNSDINSFAASLDYDPRYLHLDPRDEDGDGVPDAVRLLRAGLSTSVALDPADASGELDLSVLRPLQAVEDGAVLEIRFTVLDRPAGERTPVGFSVDVETSFGDLSGQSRAGSAITTEVWIPSDLLFADGFENGGLSRWDGALP